MHPHMSMTTLHDSYSSNPCLLVMSAKGDHLNSTPICRTADELQWYAATGDRAGTTMALHLKLAYMPIFKSTVTPNRACAVRASETARVQKGQMALVKMSHFSYPCHWQGRTGRFACIVCQGYQKAECKYCITRVTICGKSVNSRNLL